MLWIKVSQSFKRGTKAFWNWLMNDVHNTSIFEKIWWKECSFAWNNPKFFKFRIGTVSLLWINKPTFTILPVSWNVWTNLFFCDKFYFPYISNRRFPSSTWFFFKFLYNSALSHERVRAFGISWESKRWRISNEVSGHAFSRSAVIWSMPVGLFRYFQTARLVLVSVLLRKIPRTLVLTFRIFPMFVRFGRINNS